MRLRLALGQAARSPGPGPAEAAPRSSRASLMPSPAGGAEAPGARSPLGHSVGWYVRDVAASGAGSGCHRHGRPPLRSQAPRAAGRGPEREGGGERAPDRPRATVRPPTPWGGARRARGRGARGGRAATTLWRCAQCAPSHALWLHGPPSLS